MSPILTSWKEIARHVGKSTRTVQRWGRDAGFPVRRRQGSAKGGVLAIAEEIDTWVQSQPMTVDSELAKLRRAFEEVRVENRALRQQLHAITTSTPVQASDLVDSNLVLSLAVLEKSAQLLRTSAMVQEQFRRVAAVCEQNWRLLHASRKGSLIIRLLMS